jgi:hypothetical protein
MPATYSELDVKLPIILLPVRLETRYFATGAQQLELRVRIFPSPAHVTADKPGIDQIENDEAIAYWTIRKKSGDNSLDTVAAWQRVVGLFGSPRAQWLRRTLEPTVSADGSLAFPQIQIAPSAATAPLLNATATALPTRFFIAGFIGNRRAFLSPGATIPDSVSAGLHDDPAAIEWQSDFSAAEAIGLGIRIAVSPSIAPALTRLLVYGVREGSAAATSAPALQELLGRHVRTQGAALLQPGTATNNTPDQRAPTAPEAPDVTPPVLSDGDRVAKAMGVDSSLFAGVGGSTHTSELLARAMHTAVWPAAPEYFLEQAMSPLFSSTGLSRARGLFSSYVRPLGPYPTLLLGSQPFGVLPVTSTARWKTAADTEDPLLNGLRTLLPQWLAAAAKAPRLGATTDPGADLINVLSQSPVSRRWVGRSVESSLIAGRSFDGDPTRYQMIIDLARQRRVAAELGPLGLTGMPLALDFVFENSTFNLRAPLVAPPGSDRNAPLSANYIQAILTANVEALKSESFPSATPRTILYILLRHATLLELAKAASHVLNKDILRDTAFLESTTDTAWSRLTTPVAALGNRSLSDAIDSGTVPTTPALQLLNLHREALKTLASASVSDLEHLTAGAVDCASHRLDAWITAHATERLAAMRNSTPAGMHLGAWACIDAPPFSAKLAQDGAPPDVDPGSQGYILAPRLEQSKAAAVLRSVYLARHGQQSQASLAIDLSSDRVRLAKTLIAEIQGGASLSAALGARIERLAIESGLGPQVASFRDSFPLDSGEGRKRIDGLALAHAWHGAPIAALFAPLAKGLDELLDALGDLLLAESVQLYASGNPKRAQVALNAIETGTSFPDSFEILRTEPLSSSTSWRIVIPSAFDQLDAWITSLIGDPALLVAEVTPPSGTLTHIALSSLNVTPSQLLDFVQDGPEAPALRTRFISVPNSTVAFTQPLQLALTAAWAISLLTRSSRALHPDDLGVIGTSTPATPLPEFSKASQIKTWLHDLARFRPSLNGLDVLDFVARSRGSSLDLRFLSAGQGLNIISIGPPPATAQQGTLLDGWNETTPSTNATAGLAMHYEAPRSRAPQSILIAVPPDPTAGWSSDALEACLLETMDLALIRMVRPSDVHGDFLPGLYFADNLQADTVATNFYPIAWVTQTKISEVNS